MDIQIAQGIGEVVDRYDAFVVDLWGTIHNGVQPFPGAVETQKKPEATMRFRPGVESFARPVRRYSPCPRE